MIARRGGFTLMEMVIVLVVLVLAASVALPAFVSFGEARNRRPAEELLQVLRDARRVAVETGTTVTLVVDPVSGRYQADSSGEFGWGVLADSALALGLGASLETDSARVRFVFSRTGAALSDSVIVRGGDGVVAVLVDPWTGVARAEAR